MSNIEPTEEQKQAAAAFVARHGEQNEVIDSGGQARIEWSPTHTVDDIARLLAEREAKLREGLVRIIEAVHVQMAATALPQPLIDVVRGVYAEHPYALHRIEDLEKVCHALQDERDTLRARVAELEGQVSESTRLRMTETLHGMGVEAMYQEREAQHLADIKAAKEKLVDTQRAIRGGLDVYAEDFDELLARLAHYDDAKAAEGGAG